MRRIWTAGVVVCVLWAIPSIGLAETLRESRWALVETGQDLPADLTAPEGKSRWDLTSIQMGETWLRTLVADRDGSGIRLRERSLQDEQAPTEVMFDLVFYPVDSAQVLDSDTARLLSAICGGLMFGLGVMLWVVATELCRKDPALGRRIILLGIVSWYVVDSSMSVAAGAPINVLFNTAFLLLFVLPLRGFPKAVEAP